VIKHGESKCALEVLSRVLQYNTIDVAGQKKSKCSLSILHVSHSRWNFNIQLNIIALTHEVSEEALECGLSLVIVICDM
jgi:hypothetical protein